MSTETIIIAHMYAISIYGIAKLNLPTGATLADSLETVHRPNQDFSAFKSFNLNHIAEKIEMGSISKYIAINILEQKMKKLYDDFYNIIILFLPFLITLFLAYDTGSYIFITLAVIHFAFGMDTYRIFSGYADSVEAGISSKYALETSLGAEKTAYLKVKKLDMFLETWVISAFFMILFVSGL